MYHGMLDKTEKMRWHTEKNEKIIKMFKMTKHYFFEQKHAYHKSVWYLESWQS